MVERSLAFIAGVALAASLGASSLAAEDGVPLSRVLLTVTDLKASIAKVSLARYYLERSREGPGADGGGRQNVERASRSLEAALFYVASSLAFSTGELRSDLETLEGEIERLQARLVREPTKAPVALESLDALKELEERLREVLGFIDRAARTYKGSAGWMPSWEAPDGKPTPPPAPPP